MVNDERWIHIFLFITKVLFSLFHFQNKKKFFNLFSKILLFNKKIKSFLKFCLISSQIKEECGYFFFLYKLQFFEKYNCFLIQFKINSFNSLNCTNNNLFFYKKKILSHWQSNKDDDKIFFFLVLKLG